MALDVRLTKGLEGFDLDVELLLDEELLVLFGPSGAGKTMILKMISGIVRPDAGRVTLGSRRLFDSTAGLDVPIRDRKIGYLFQDYALFPHMTVAANINYGSPGPKGAAGARKAADLIALMRLSGLEERYPHELSGGQKQRVALARTLASEPDILLLDEPFSALDYQVREKLRMDLLNIHKMFPITTVLVTHDLEEAFMLGRRMAVVNNGRIEQMGLREEVFYRPKTRNVARFMGFRNIFDGAVVRTDSQYVVVDCKGLGMVKAIRHPEADLKPGQSVSLCIRPEEILVIRPDRAVDPKVQDNIFDCEIVSTIGRGSTHILFLKTGINDTLLKVELPNFVLRKLGLATGRAVRVSLKKESVWVIT